MGQPIHCDYAGEPHLADVMITRIANGETLAWCDEHYVEVCRAIAEAVDGQERAQADAAALAALGAAPAGDGPPTSPGSSDAGDPPAVPPTAPDSGPPKRVRHSGASPSTGEAPEPNLGATDDPGEAGSAPR